MGTLHDAFISYGRADSKAFTLRLNDRLVAAGLSVWVDFEGIPLAVDYQNQIDDGIEKADNFVFVIAPHSVNSIYCRREIDHALKYNKRIIPLLHVPQISRETWQQRHPQGTDAEWAEYQAKGLCYGDDRNPNLHPVIAQINWVPFVEGASDFEASCQKLLAIFARDQDYVRRHTVYLAHALTWERQQRQGRYLLIGEERQQAQTWLKTRFQEEQPPCLPTDLHCEFITESIKNAENLMTQVFLSHAEEDSTLAAQVRRRLMREGFTVWTSKIDIQTGVEFQEAINRGIEEANTIVYLLSPEALRSHYCQQEITYALALNKRLIPILVRATDTSLVPTALRGLQYIDLSDNLVATDYRSDESQLIKILRQDAAYYEDHKQLLAKALKWERQHQNPTMLLRGYNLNHFETWLRVGKQRDQHPPLPIQEAFITESLRQPPGVALDVFVSYSRVDSDFARRLNEALQTQGKTTWFDQESIASSSDFQQEIYRGIETADHFLFILSPNSINSPYCADEVEYAQKLNKRIVTVLYRPISTASLHPGLAAVQWIDFNQRDGDFAANFNELLRSLDTDRDHLRIHTRLLVRAIEWENAGRKDSLLLLGDDLEQAEQWLAHSGHKEPKPTALHGSYIHSGRAAANAQQQATQILQAAAAKGRQRVLIGTTVMAIGLAIAGVAGFFALQAQQEAMAAAQQASRAKQQAIAAQAQMSQAEQRAQQAKEQLAQAIVKVNAAEQRQKVAEQKIQVAEQRLQIAAARTAQAERQLQFAQRQVQLAQISLQQATLARAAALAAKQEAQTGTRLERDSVNALKLFDVQQLDALLTAMQTGQELRTLAGDRPLDLYPAIGPLFALQTILDNIRERNRIVAHQGQVLAVNFLPDQQRFVTAGADKTLRLWNLAGQQQAVFNLGQADLWSVGISPDGQQVAAIASNGILHLWQRNQQELQVQQAFPVSKGSFASVGFSPDGKTLATLGKDGMLYRWSREGKQQVALPVNGTNFAFSPDGQGLAIASRDGTISLWNLTTQQRDRTFNTQQQPILSLSFSPDGQRLATGGRDGQVRLWNLGGKLLDTFNTQQAFVLSLSFSPDGQQLATADAEGGVRLWRLATRALENFSTDQERVLSVHFSPNGQQLLTAGGTASVQVWTIAGQPLPVLPMEQNVLAVGISPDGQSIATATDDGRVQIRDRRGNPLSPAFQAHQGNAFSVSFSPDGRQLLTAGIDSTVRLWSLAGQPLATLKVQVGAVYSANFSPDGKTIVTASEDGMVRWWTLAGKPLDGFKAHQGRKVWSLSLSPDGQMFATASEDGSVRLWSTTKNLLAEFKNFPYKILSVSFSPDGKRLAAGDENGSIRLIPVEPLPTLLTRGCSWLSGYLTTLKWQGNRPLCIATQPPKP